jgi:hypothetical protein
MLFFSDRKLTVELGQYIRRICDRTIPNHASGDELFRRYERLNRSIPTLICPWENRKPAVDQAVFALTTDVSSRGVGLLVNQPTHVHDVLLGYWIDPEEAGQPWFFLGSIRHEEPAGGGYWRVGVELTEFVNSRHPEALRDLHDLAAQLLPPALTAVEV